ncbi:MAG: hypothetical protein II781_02435 [Clostridia bacterium]|nr:hypothetical protein [Clostridia bacterium]
MEPFLADFLKNSKVPVWIRIAVLCGIIGVLEVICILGGNASPSLVGRILCFGIAGLILTGGIYVLLYRVWTAQSGKEENRNGKNRE